MPFRSMQIWNFQVDYCTPYSLHMLPYIHLQVLHVCNYFVEVQLNVYAESYCI